VTPLLSNTLLRAQSDDRLLRLAAAGHDRAFEAIVERYRKPLLRFVRRLLPDPRAEDIVQATFVSAWASLRRGADVRELRPWLYRIAHNGAVNVLKRAGEHHDELAESLRAVAGTDAAVEQRDHVRRTLRAVADLPDRQRAALLAVAVDGRSHADVADELGLSDGALRQLVHRARTSLRAVATAVTPSPLAAAALAGGGSGASDRVAEVAAGAGGAGLAASAMKAGAVVVAAGAIVVGAPQLAQRERHPPTHRPTAPATKPAEQAGAAPRAAAVPVSASAQQVPVALEDEVSAGHGGDDGSHRGSAPGSGDDHGGTSARSGPSGERESTRGDHDRGTSPSTSGRAPESGGGDGAVDTSGTGETEGRNGGSRGESSPSAGTGSSGSGVSPAGTSGGNNVGSSSGSSGPNLSGGSTSGPSPSGSSSGSSSVSGGLSTRDDGR
jgi:RNA polymerase sigma factor (sigma-70 family)